MKIVAFGLTLALGSGLPGAARADDAQAAQADWQPCGWGGGGFFYSAVFHPTRDGVIYMGGDVNGTYRTDDHGLHWKIINNGLIDHGVFSLAVDRTNPDTVYAATEGGLCKSVDQGEHWQLLPQTGKKDLHITGEKGKSFRSVAVDPTNGNNVYAGTPLGKVYKSADGGQSWNVAYTVPVAAAPPGTLRGQFGKASGGAYGGFWFQMKYPDGANAAECTGIGFRFQAQPNKAVTLPRTCLVIVQTSAGVSYRSKNLPEIFGSAEPQTVILNTADFALDPDYVAKNPAKAATLPPKPDWATVNRLDFACSGALDQEAYAGGFSTFFYVTPAGQTPIKDFTVDKDIKTYANFRLGEATGGPVFTVAVSPKNPLLVAAASADVGLVLSQDGGTTWKELDTPKKASGVTFDPSDPNTLYGAFFGDGIWRSTDLGKSWTKLTEGVAADFNFHEVVVGPPLPASAHPTPSAPANGKAPAPLPATFSDLYAIGDKAWAGGLYVSNDNGATWKRISELHVDIDADPTMQRVFSSSPKMTTALSAPTNLTINPAKPSELYMSANWWPCWSDDGGMTWHERDRGADITCVADIRFGSNGKKTYVSAMDEGTLVTENGGETWRQLWPLKFTADLSGHDWRLNVTSVNGVDRIISTVTPWDGRYPNRVVVSEDGGGTFRVTTEGLPNYLPHENVMWGTGYARALAVDPKNPMIVYLGIDGDATSTKSGGGVFKSLDGGLTWKQLANQPGSRRMFYGLAVDPTESKRIYWSGMGMKGGVYRSEDGGESWKNVLPNNQWCFNIHVGPDGAIYALDTNVWRSVDHGENWKKITNFPENWAGMGFDIDPQNPKTMWLSRGTWDGGSTGGVYKTVDGGATWDLITGNIPYVKPMVLRFNPETRELWAGGVGIYKLKQPLVAPSN
ncbi:hypothetical protein SAMN05444156_1699 [Verrucomicrobium sp. GAS474]|nr:hypothetical protein SAMN05444156_1699 [Verrucomicrobium sp. GAS474]